MTGTAHPGLYMEPGPRDRVHFQTDGELRSVSIGDIRSALRRHEDRDRQTSYFARNHVDHSDLTALLRYAEEQVRARAKAGTL